MLFSGCRINSALFRTQILVPIPARWRRLCQGGNPWERDRPLLLVHDCRGDKETSWNCFVFLSLHGHVVSPSEYSYLALTSKNINLANGFVDSQLCVCVCVCVFGTFGSQTDKQTSTEYLADVLERDFAGRSVPVRGFQEGG